MRVICSDNVVSGRHIIAGQSCIMTNGYQYEISLKIHSHPEKLDLVPDDIQMLFSCHKYYDKRRDENILVECR
jgi:hypothetical protein